MKPVRDMELGSFVCSNSGAYILILGGETFLNAPCNEKCVLRPLSVLHSIVTTLTIREWSDA